MQTPVNLRPGFPGQKQSLSLNTQDRTATPYLLALFSWPLSHRCRRGKLNPPTKARLSESYEEFAAIYLCNC